MPQVSQQLTAARQAAHARLTTMKNWLEADDIKKVAAESGLTPGTVNQIKKGVKWNSTAVELLIEAVEAKKLYYEKIAGSPLNEETGEPFSSSQNDENEKRSRKPRRRTDKPAKKDAG